MLVLNLQIVLCALLSLTTAAVVAYPPNNIDARDASPVSVLVGKRQYSKTPINRNPTTTLRTSTTTTSTLGRSNPTVTSSASKSSSTTTTSSSSSRSSSTTTHSSTTSATSSSSTTSAGPMVTDTAYIDTVIRHHNVHRSNHSANAVTWSSSLADTARQIAQSCYYAHNTTANGGGYGQNIAAGYIGTQIGAPITLGFYNSEVNAYASYYGAEPDMNNFGSYGHFTQIVWKSTTSVGCYTMDCTNQPGGLQNVPAGVGPYFTVCNYGPPGNYVGEFNANVGRPTGAATVYANYGCPSNNNCA